MNVAVAVFLISILIFVHELGHYLAAKLSGIWVEEFGIGFPPRIWGKKIGGTLYSINALPIGGFVRLHGEEIGDKTKYPDRAYKNKSKCARAFVGVSGVLMNMFLAVIVLTIINWSLGISKGVVVVEVTEDTPAEAAGILEGDEIIAFDGKDMVFTGKFGEVVFENRGQKVTLQIKRDGVVRDMDIIVRSEAPSGEGLLGVTYAPRETYQPPLWQRPFVYLYLGFLNTLALAGQIVAGFRHLFLTLLGGKVPAGVVGPLGVTALVAEAAKMGILPLLDFLALISVNLAVLNLIPFAPLDGYRIFLIGVEGVFGKRLVPKAEQYIQMGGIAVLLGLMFLLTGNEISRIIEAGSLSGFVKGLLQQ